ncbi:MAG TPA: hypothetical protein VF715_16185 [Thermoleophilaceae bacterium]
MASLQGLEGVAAGASARVGEILAEAERIARDVHAEADRAVAASRRSAEQEVERIAEEAREAARAAARERAEELAALQAALTARGPAVVEGLEGAGVTRARLEAVIEALGAAAGDVTAAAEEGDPRVGAAPGPEAEASPDAEASPASAPASAPDAEPEPDGSFDTAAASPVSETAAGEGEDPAPEDSAEAAAAEVAAAEAGHADAKADPVAVAEDLAKPVAHAVPAEAAPDDPAPADGDERGGALAPAPLNGDGAYDGSLPEGAPLARKPQRSRERDARFAALLLAVQGRPRDEVDAHLRSEYGFADVEPILDEVFGPARA